MAIYTVDASPPIYVFSTNQFIPAPEMHKIRDWLLWSIVSIFIGWGLGGILPLMFSVICRNNKRNNHIQRARLMSTFALVFNILFTLGGIVGWIVVIVWMIYFSRATNSINKANIQNKNSFF